MQEIANLQTLLENLQLESKTLKTHLISVQDSFVYNLEVLQLSDMEVGRYKDFVQYMLEKTTQINSKLKSLQLKQNGQIKNISEKIESVTRKIAALTHDNHSKASNIQKLKRQLTARENVIKQLADSNSRSQELLNSNAEKLNEKASINTAQARSICTLEDDLNRERQEMITERSILQTSNEQIVVHNQKLIESNGEHGVLIVQLTEKIEIQEAADRRQTELIKNKEKEKLQLKSRLEEAELEVKTLQINANERKDWYSNEITTLNSQLTELNAKNLKLQNESKVKTETILKLESHIKFLESKNCEFLEKLGCDHRLKDTILSLQQSNADLISKSMEMEFSLKRLQTENQCLGGAVESQSHTISTQLKDIQLLKQQLNYSAAQYNITDENYNFKLERENLSLLRMVKKLQDNNVISSNASNDDEFRDRLEIALQELNCAFQENLKLQSICNDLKSKVQPEIALKKGGIKC